MGEATYVDGRSRGECVYLAKLAEQAERYEDMVTYMRSIAEGDQELSVEERNLLSVAYKNVIGARRASWRVLSNLETKEKLKSDSERVSLIVPYREKVEKELDTVCGEILDLIKGSLIPMADNGSGPEVAESKVFYHKMAGDYNRYLAEFKEGDDRRNCSEFALDEYKKASDIAEGEDGLAPTHPIRLGLALNLSVFYYEILAQQDKACTLAKTAFDEAIAELDSLQEESYKDATLIMQLLRDNLTLWTTDEEKD